MSIQSRIEKAERTLRIDAEARPVPVVILCAEWGMDENTIPEFPEPITEWVTLRRAADEANRTRLPCAFQANPFAEYEARHGIEPGTLTNHESRGKVPFERLLELAGQAVTQKAAPEATADDEKNGGTDGI